jgi:hypothetical protein
MVLDAGVLRGTAFDIEFARVPRLAIDVASLLAHAPRAARDER